MRVAALWRRNKGGTAELIRPLVKKGGFFIERNAEAKVLALTRPHSKNREKGVRYGKKSCENL
ncbi:hypothetical protein D3Z38_00205 [Clostridiales bacterium]|nr:hypothetical protein [Clostridiales bacterium]